MGSCRIWALSLAARRATRRALRRQRPAVAAYQVAAQKKKIPTLYPFHRSFFRSLAATLTQEGATRVVVTQTIATPTIDYQTLAILGVADIRMILFPTAAVLFLTRLDGAVIPQA